MTTIPARWPASILCVLLAAACGDGDPAIPDADPGDAATSDAGLAVDAGEADAPAPDAAPPDATEADAGPPDAALGDAGPEECGIHFPGVLTADGVMVSGSTVGHANTTSGACGGASAGEAIFLLTLDEYVDVTISADHPGTDFDAVLYVRSDCDAASQRACASTGALGDALIAYGLGPGTYYVFVDGVAGAEGNFELSATTAAILPEGSPCDPTGLGGRCDSGTECVDLGGGFQCTDDGVLCEASVVAIAPGDTAIGTTAGAPANYGSVCSFDGGSGEILYAFDTTVPSDLTIRATATNFESDEFDIVLSVWSACGDPSSTLDCSDSSGADTPEVISLPSSAAGRYYVSVDGYDGTEGEYELEVSSRAILPEGAACDPEEELDRCETGLTCTDVGASDRCLAAGRALAADDELNDAFCTAVGPLAGDTLVPDAQLLTPLDVDTFVIDVPAGGDLRVAASDGLGGCTTDAALALVFADGMACEALELSPPAPMATAGSAPPDTCAILDADDLAAGTYYLQVSADAGAPGAYLLLIDLD